MKKERSISCSDMVPIESSWLLKDILCRRSVITELFFSLATTKFQSGILLGKSVIYIPFRRGNEKTFVLIVIHMLAQKFRRNFSWNIKI